LFLDVDGTLLEIAETPDTVRVPARLKEVLGRAATLESGALALVSGRRIADLDALFSPWRFAAAGLHGIERRDALGRHSVAAVNPEPLRLIRRELVALALRHPTVQVEDKELTLAVHFRRAPELASSLQTWLDSLVAASGRELHVQPGKCVLEIKPSGINKRTAIEAFMGEPPFRGRRPVFVGDDLTDEDGFAAVNAQGGLSIRVGDPRPTCARFGLRHVDDVMRWLDSATQPVEERP
jgi:trehalose 6-phosphate phosphatase